MKNEEDYIGLLDDRSLFKIWWRLNVLGRKGIFESKIGKWFLIFGSVGALAQSLLAEDDWIAAQVAFISLHGFKLSTGVLSFLLSGFIFSLSAANAGLLRKLVYLTDPKTELNFLRLETFSILSLFAEFVGATFIFAFFLVFGQPGGLLGSLSQMLPAPIDLGLRQLALLILNCTLLLLVVRLKSFVTNFYHFAMTALVVSFDDLDDKEKLSK